MGIGRECEEGLELRGWKGGKVKEEKKWLFTSLVHIVDRFIDLFQGEGIRIVTLSYRATALGHDD